MSACDVKASVALMPARENSSRMEFRSGGRVWRSSTAWSASSVRA